MAKRRTVQAPSPLPAQAPTLQLPPGAPQLGNPPALESLSVPAPVLGRFVGIDAREFSFTLSRPVVAAGTVTFELRNRGEDPHNMVVSPEGTHDRLAAFEDLEAESGMAQQRADLPAGRYYLWCSLTFHEQAGMHANLRVE